MVFASFIRDAQGVKDVRKVLGKAGEKILIISKIENLQGKTYLVFYPKETLIAKRFLARKYRALKVPFSSLGPFTNYVDKNLAFLTTYPPLLTFSTF